MIFIYHIKIKMKRKIILTLVVLSSLSFSANKKTSKNITRKKVLQKSHKKTTTSNESTGNITGSPFPAVISRTAEQKQILDDYFKKRVELYKKSFTKNSLEAFAELDKSIIEFADAKEINNVVEAGRQLKKKFNEFTGKNTKIEDEHYIIREIINIFDK